MTKYVTLFAILLAGCSVQPQYQRPLIDTPAAWRDAPAAPAAEIRSDWWKDFNSAELSGLVDKAMAANNDLAAALHRIEQARASLRISGSSLLPAVNASGGLGVTRSDPSSGDNSTRGSANAGLSVSYEADLFGANRAGVDAAEATLQATAFDRDALRLVVAGEVARIYFTILNLQERIDFARKNLANVKGVLDIVSARFEAGSVSALEVARQKTSFAQAEAGVASLEREKRAAENALSVLLGEAPKDMGLKTGDLRTLAIPEVPLSQPATIVAQRPDIQAAEQGLIAANADIGAARAAFFPVLDLGAAASVALSPLSGSASNSLSLTSALLAPIFRGGALEGGVELAEARQKELAENYRKTVLTAFQEVEDALAAVRAAKIREKALAEAASEARKAYAISRELFDAGSTDYEALLDAERTLIGADDSYAAVRLESLQAAVDLYKALGCGWKKSGM